MPGRNRRSPKDGVAPAAAGGILGRRALLFGGGLLGVGAANAGAAALPVPAWGMEPGLDFELYGQVSRFEQHVARKITRIGDMPGNGSAQTPLHLLDGMLTPSGLHFERSHSGVPDIDPDAHRLVIHGLVKRPLMFSLETLSRYPMHSQIVFLECSGNSAYQDRESPLDAGVQAIHGSLSCTEWTGVKLSHLLDEAGVTREAHWLLAEGADAANMSRSIPLSKAMDDALIAIYQNGERLRPANGYPMRLILPGFEGSLSIKWLRRLKAIASPMMTRDETSKYTMLLPSGRARQFVFPMNVKSVICRPSPELTLGAPGYYEISGLAWSGHGSIARVEISADAGKSWAEAHLQAPVLPRALTRFRAPWRWDGSPAILQSRATDERGHVQPRRDALVAERGVGRAVYHYNAIQSWAVDAGGRVRNVFA